MKTVKLKTATSLAFVVAAGLVTGSAFAKEPFFGGKTDVQFAGKIWESMEKHNLVGDNSINVYPFKGNEPHGAIQQVIDTDLTVDGTTSRILVKRNHGGPGASIKSVYANPKKHLKAITVMYQRESGYDAENKNWFWAKYLPDGTIDKNPKGALLAGRIGKNAGAGCIACHRALGGSDLETLTIK